MRDEIGVVNRTERRSGLVLSTVGYLFFFINLYFFADGASTAFDLSSVIQTVKSGFCLNNSK